MQVCFENPLSQVELFFPDEKIPERRLTHIGIYEGNFFHFR